jgi:hypothetical protein
LSALVVACGLGVTACASSVGPSPGVDASSHPAITDGGAPWRFDPGDGAVDAARADATSADATSAGASDAFVAIDASDAAIPSSCRSDADCVGGLVCMFDAPGCGALGACVVSHAGQCAAEFVFCGCDGTTFRLSCDVPHVAYLHEGACTDAGDAGDAAVTDASPADASAGCHTSADCARPDGGQWQICEFPAPGCGTSGVCVAHYLDECLGIVDPHPPMPYCGCDGVTVYSSCTGGIEHPWMHPGVCEMTAPMCPAARPTDGDPCLAAPATGCAYGSCGDDVGERRVCTCTTARTWACAPDLLCP